MDQDIRSKMDGRRVQKVFLSLIYIFSLLDPAWWVHVLFFFVILRIFSISTIGPDYLTSAAGVVIIPIDGEYIYIVICKNIKKR